MEELLLSVLNVQGACVLGRLKYRQQSDFLPEPTATEDEVAIRKLKNYKSPGSDQIAAELIQAKRGGILHSEIHKLVMLIWNKEELPHQWKESVAVPIHQKGYKTGYSNYQGISLL
jgi:hypothetical protein